MRWYGERMQRKVPRTMPEGTTVEEERLVKRLRKEVQERSEKTWKYYRKSQEKSIGGREY